MTDHRQTAPRTLALALAELAGKPIEGEEEYRLACDGARTSLYLGGEKNPFTWTSFVERAFVFGSRADAESILAEFPWLFQGAGRLVITKRSAP